MAEHLWFEWVDTLRAVTRDPDTSFLVPIPLWVRMVAAVVVIWGARTDRRWTVPVASMLALPILWINGLAMLVGVVALIPERLGPTPASRWLAAAGARG